MQCWLTHGETVLDVDYRKFLPVHNDALTSPVTAYLDCSGRSISPVQYRGGSPETGSSETGVVSAAMLEIVGMVVQQLRRLDDREGGNLRNLRFAHRQVLTIGQYICSGEAENSAVLHELLGLWMQACQVTGWMAYDAEQHGLAQRYWYTGLHAARSVTDRAYGAYLIFLLANQAVYLGRAKEAAALAGDRYGFDSAAAQAQSLLADPAAPQDRPGWLYWYGGAQCRVRHSHALISAAGSSRSQLEHAARLLAPNAVLDNTDFPRQAAYNRVWLVRNQLRRGELRAALDTAEAIVGPDVVRSPRCLTQLRVLDGELAAVTGTAGASRSRLGEFRGELHQLLG
ncbi:MAG: hypothetical protein ACRDPW_03580 [Mycobacteriales bacterium]